MAISPLPGNVRYLSHTEFRIFSLLSKRSPLTIREIGTALARMDPDFSQGHNSLATTLQRIVEKGYVEQQGGGTTARHYRPTFPYDLALKLHVERFLDDHMISEPHELRAALQILLDRLAPAGPRDAGSS